MAIINKNQLLNYSTEKTINSINESLQELKADKYNKTVTIFLSHKHSEVKELEAAIKFLKSFRVSVYVAWLDEEMPKKTSGETASKLKSKIKNSDKFILLATEEAINSKWCNWELGIGDVNKYLDDIAIFPIRDFGGTYTGSEYLQIYPYIMEENPLYYVVNPDGKRNSLVAWLTGINKFFNK